MPRAEMLDQNWIWTKQLWNGIGERGCNRPLIDSFGGQMLRTQHVAQPINAVPLDYRCQIETSNLYRPARKVI